MSDADPCLPGHEYERSLDRVARKRAGRFYTPGPIARFLVRAALQSLVAEQADPTALRILDPAAGAGHFLMAARDFLFEECARRELVRTPEQIENCLWGVDTDADALALAARAVPGAHLLEADALAPLPEPFERGGFAAVLGNPPFLRELNNGPRFAAVRDSELGRRWGASKMNFWYFFTHRALELLAPDGVQAFVCPAYWPWSDSSARLIEHMTERHRVSLFVDFGRNGIFAKVSERCSLYVLRPAGDESLCVQFEPGVGRDGIRRGLDALPEPVPGVTRVRRRPWIQVPRDGRLQLGVDELPGPRPAGSTIALGEIDGVHVTQGVAQNPDRVSQRNLRHAAEQLGTDPQTLAERHGIAIGDGVFVLSDAEAAALALTPGDRALLDPFYDAQDLRRLTGLPPANKRVIFSAPSTSAQVHESAALSAHLARYRFLMDLRRETRQGRLPWWQMHWPRQRHYFTGPRLLVPQMSARPSFTFTDAPGVVNLSVNVIVCRDRALALRLWVLLNGPGLIAELEAGTKRRGLNIDLGVGRIREIRLPIDALAADFDAVFETVRALEEAGAAPDAIRRVFANVEISTPAAG